MKKIKFLMMLCTIGAISMISLYALKHPVKADVVLKYKKYNPQVEPDSFRDGDLIFQSSTAGQGLAIQLATHSKYTHIGVMFRKDGAWKVYEAVEPVQVVSFKTFTSRGDGKYVVKRLKGSDTLLTEAKLALMKGYLKKQLDKHYDIHFGWSDDRMYCSELAWKCYQKAGLSAGPLKKLKEFDLSNPLVQKIMEQRYGKNIPYNEQVISPGDIFDNKDMVEVPRN